MAALPAIRLPEIDVPKLDLAHVKVPDAITRMELPDFTMPHVDLVATAKDAAVAAGLRRPARRSRLPFAIGGLIVAGTALGIMNSPELRNRLRGFAMTVRERISSMRSNAWERADPIAFPAAATKPIQPDPWDSGEDIGLPDYPEGLGSRNDDAMPAQEESTSPI